MVKENIKIDESEKSKDTKDTSSKPSSMLHYYSKDLFDIEDMPPMDINELSRLYHNKAYINPDAMVSFSVDALNDMLRTTFIISPDKMKETSDKIMQNIHTLVNLKSREDPEGEMDFSQDDIDEILKPLDPTERDDAKVAVGISLGIINHLKEVVAQKYRVTNNYKLDQMNLRSIAQDKNYPMSRQDREAYKLLSEEMDKNKAIYETILEFDSNQEYKDLDTQEFSSVMLEDKFADFSKRAREIYKNITDDENASLSTFDIQERLKVFGEEFSKNDPYSFAPYAGISLDDQNSLVNSPTLMKFSSHPGGEALLFSSCYEKAIEKSLKNTLLSNGQSLKDYAEQKLKITPKELMSNDVLVKDINNTTSSEYREDVKDFVKLSNAVTAISLLSKNKKLINKDSKEMKALLDIIPQDFKKEYLSDMFEDKDLSKPKNDIDHALLHILSGVERIRKNTSLSDEKKEELAEQKRHLVANLADQTRQDLTKDAIYHYIAGQKTTGEPLRNVASLVKPAAYRSFVRCLNSSKTPKTSVETQESLQTSCVDKFIDALDRESKETIQALSGVPGLVFGVSGISAFIALFAIYMDIKKHAAQNNLVKLEQLRYRLAAIMQDVQENNNEFDAKAAKLYWAIKMNNQSFLSEDFKLDEKKAMKHYLFLNFARDVSTLYDFNTEYKQDLQLDAKNKVKREVDEALLGFYNALGSNKNEVLSQIKATKREIEILQRTLQQGKYRLDQFKSALKKPTITAMQKNDLLIMEQNIQKIKTQLAQKQNILNQNMDKLRNIENSDDENNLLKYKDEKFKKDYYDFISQINQIGFIDNMDDLSSVATDENIKKTILQKQEEVLRKLILKTAKIDNKNTPKAYDGTSNLTSEEKIQLSFLTELYMKNEKLSKSYLNGLSKRVEKSVFENYDVGDFFHEIDNSVVENILQRERNKFVEHSPDPLESDQVKIIDSSQEREIMGDSFSFVMGSEKNIEENIESRKNVHSRYNDYTQQNTRQNKRSF